MIGAEFPRAVLFDWDNTLIENWGTIRDALNAALVDAGKPPFDMAQVLEAARYAARESFPRLFGEGWQRARDIFYDHFRTHHLDGLRILPGAVRALDALADQGIPLAIVSNKNGTALRREVAHLGWSERFATIVGALDAPADKPDPAPVIQAAAALGIAPGPGVWMVGDTDIDMRAAIAAGVDPVLIGPGPENPDLIAGLSIGQRFEDCDALAGFVLRTRRTISR